MTKNELRKRILGIDVPKKLENVEEFNMEDICSSILSSIKVSSKKDITTLRDVVSQIVMETQVDIQKKTFEDILSGNIKIESDEDMEKLPMYRKVMSDGSIQILNIPKNILSWYRLQAFLNEMSA